MSAGKKNGWNLVSLAGVALLAGLVSSCSGTTDKSGPSGNSTAGQWPITGTSADELAAGILGDELGQDLSRDALKNALLSEYQALESGQTGNTVTWQSKSFLIGRVTPQQVYEVGESSCRRYEHVIVQGAKRKSAIGTACKDKSGIWRPLV